MRAIAVCNAIADELELSLFNQYPHANSTIRSSCTGSQRQSRLWRTSQEADLLGPERSRIRIVHAQGSLNFAAIESLVLELVSILDDDRTLVLDLAS